MNQDITSYLSKGKLQININQEVRARARRTDYTKTKQTVQKKPCEERQSLPEDQEQTPVQQVRNTGPKVEETILALGKRKKFKIVG